MLNLQFNGGKELPMNVWVAENQFSTPNSIYKSPLLVFSELFGNIKRNKGERHQIR